MRQNSAKTHELRNRICFTLMIMVIYVLGRNVLLYGIDPAACGADAQDAESLIVSMVSGDRYRYTIMALGIMPGITAGMLIQIGIAMAGRDARSRTSPLGIRRWTMVLMLVLAVLFAVDRAGSLTLSEELPMPEIAVRAIDAGTMVFGAWLIYVMTDRNKQRGIGGQTAVILFNVADGLIGTLQGHDLQELKLPLLLCAVMTIVMLFMELTTVKIRVQRVSIHSAYADKDYLAFKLNPIGVMPVMFATVFFMLPQLVVSLACAAAPGNRTLVMLTQNMVMSRPLGAAVYLMIVFLLTVVFTFVLLSPSDIAEQLQKNGDSIVGVYAGVKTRRYLRRRLFLLGVFSGTVLTAGMGVSLFLSLQGKIPTALAMIPSSAMIFTGLFISLVQEILAWRRYDSYSFFV